MCDFFGPFWAQLWKYSNFLQKLWSPFYKLSMIYHTTILNKNPFLTLFGHFWSNLVPNNEDFQKFIQKLRSSYHKLFNDIWFDYIQRKLIFDPFLFLFWGILGHFGPTIYFIYHFLPKLWSRRHKFSNGMSYDFV